jgi:hypothetical protein
MMNYEISVSKGYLAAAIGGVFDRAYYFDPARRHETDRVCHEYVRRALSDIAVFYTESNLGRLKYYDSQQVLVGGIQPNMILGMLLGADFIANDKMDADISPVCWAGKNLDALPAPEELLRHDLIRLFDSQIFAVRKDAGKTPIPPFFWDASGRAAIHGAMTTAQKFLGEQIFIDMLTDPDDLKKMTGWIIESCIVLVRHFAETAGIEISSVHIGECSSCMIGPDQFKEFVAPGLNRIGETLGPVRLHSCGQSNHILKVCKESVPVLGSLDLGGESSIAKVRELFGKEFPVSIAPQVKDLSADSPDAALRWLDQVLAENDGGELTVLCHIEPEYSLKTVRKVFSRLQ